MEITHCSLINRCNLGNKEKNLVAPKKKVIEITGNKTITVNFNVYFEYLEQSVEKDNYQYGQKPHRKTFTKSNKNKIPKQTKVILTRKN